LNLILDLIPFFLAVFVIAVGILNWKGKLSVVHSVQRRNVLKEEKIYFDRTVGLAVIIAGVSMTGVAAALAAARLEMEVLTKISGGLGLAGGLIGTAVYTYAIIKYNRYL